MALGVRPTNKRADTCRQQLRLRVPQPHCWQSFFTGRRHHPYQRLPQISKISLRNEGNLRSVLIYIVKL